MPINPESVNTDYYETDAENLGTDSSLDSSGATNATQTQPESTTSSFGNRQLGAKILANSNFESRQPIVTSSFNKALKKGEKLPGKNGERRNHAYLARLENLIAKHGNTMEKKLWKASIKDSLLINYDKITKSYWDTKRQELRDNGYGNVKLTEELKHQYYEKEREFQQESLEKWVNYLGDEHSPYPLWFKIYAWDGMTKMGNYSKGKNRYEVRNETTIAPYPDPDPEILAGVFDVINRYHGNGEKGFYTEDGERNINLEKIVQSGNFSKIYNAIRQDIAPVIEPPEKAEDVKGEWVEYGLGEEDDIARAAKGTGWCVAASSVGRHYLEYGTYGHDEDDEYDEYDEYDEDDDYYEDEDYYNDGNEYYNEVKKNKAKFIIFHLIDPKTGRLAKNGCASIRLDPDGKVAEISGLKGGQALNDSVVSIVEEKVKSLPGGEEFLPKFADKNRLIALDRKMKKGEDLTKEELEFLYEIHREINSLDTYNHYDPRIRELREEYGIEYALDHGIDPDSLVQHLYLWELDDNLDVLISHGANIDNLVSQLQLHPGYPENIAYNLDTLISHGANIDIDNLVQDLHPEVVADNLDTLISHGANIDIDNLVLQLDYLDSIVNYLGTLISHGTNIDNLASQLQPRSVANNLDTLISHGANINIDNLVSRLGPYEIADNLDAFISHGANIDNLVSRLDPYGIVDNLDVLISHGANINIDNLVSRLGPYGVVDNLDVLISHGANINIDNLVSQLHPNSIVNNLDTLISHGVNIDNLVSRLGPYEIADNLDTLISHGANINIDNLVSQLHPNSIVNNLDTLISHGANIDNLVSRLNQDYIENNKNILRKYGAKI